MSEGSHGSHFKLILALVMIAGIMGLIAYANSGQQFLKAFKLGKFADAQKTTSKPFGIVLTTVTDTLYVKSFTLTNSVVNLKGLCSTIKLDTVKTKIGDRCNFVSNDATGTLQYGAGNIMVSGVSPAIILDSKESTNDQGMVSFEIEIIPMEFSIAGVSADVLSMSAPSGQVEVYNEKGEWQLTAGLQGTSLTLTKLSGTITLNNGEIKINGIVTSLERDGKQLY